jgi:hypothetical protein
MWDEAFYLEYRSSWYNTISQTMQFKNRQKYQTDISFKIYNTLVNT